MHRFRDIAFYSIGLKSLYSANPLVFNSPEGGVPLAWDDLRKILSGCQHRATVLNGVETLPKISIAWVGCTKGERYGQTTDRRTGDNI